MDSSVVFQLNLRASLPHIPIPRLQETIDVITALDKSSHSTRVKTHVLQVLLAELQAEDNIRQSMASLRTPIPAASAMDGPPPIISPVSPASPSTLPVLSPVSPVQQNNTALQTALLSLVPLISSLTSPLMYASNFGPSSSQASPPPPTVEQTASSPVSTATVSSSATPSNEEASPKRSGSVTPPSSSPETCPASPRSPGGPATFFWTMEMQGNNAPAKPRRRARAKNPAAFFCHKCGTTETIEWRRGPDNCKSLCNGCGLRFAKMVKKELRTPPNPTCSFAVDTLLNPIN
ncbi:hypothetical protein Pelo_11599 [Pelomyxa schiedti]|nr:hypothetical protein Pelo_11599 [Pelomyxa schiedti]